MEIFISLSLLVITIILAMLALWDLLIKWTPRIVAIILLVGFIILWGIFGTWDVLLKNASEQRNVQTGVDTTLSAEIRVKAAIDSTRSSVIDSIKHLGENATLYYQSQAYQEKSNKEELLQKLNENKIEPILDVVPISQGEINPYVQLINGEDFLNVHFTTYNLNESEAYALETSFCVVMYRNDKLTVLQTKIRKPTNNRQPLYKTNRNYQSLDFIGEFKPTCMIYPEHKDTLFLCYGLDYQNKAGKRQKPLHKVYLFNCDHINKQLIAEQGHYNEIEDFLVAKRIWNR